MMEAPLLDMCFLLFSDRLRDATSGPRSIQFGIKRGISRIWAEGERAEPKAAHSQENGLRREHFWWHSSESVARRKRTAFFFSSKGTLPGEFAEVCRSPIAFSPRTFLCRHRITHRACKITSLPDV